MQYLIVIALILAGLYVAAGALMGWFEMSQTDDPFRLSQLALWLPRMFGFFN